VGLRWLFARRWHQCLHTRRRLCNPRTLGMICCPGPSRPPWIAAPGVSWADTVWPQQIACADQRTYREGRYKETGHPLCLLHCRSLDVALNRITAPATRKSAVPVGKRTSEHLAHVRHQLGSPPASQPPSRGRKSDRGPAGAGPFPGANLVRSGLTRGTIPG
jgi:hypothetical protein